MKRNKVIGIFGLSGDPPQASHKTIIDHCIKYNLVDEVWVIPSHSHTQKTNIASFNQRMKMCTLMFTGWFKPVKVLDYDFYNPSGTMYRLMEMIIKDHQFDNVKFKIIIGRDCADNIESWYNWKYLIDKYPFIVFDREEFKYQKHLEWYNRSKHQLIISNDDLDLSSTYVRKLIKEDRFHLVNTATNKKVVKYIIKNKLYGTTI